MLDFLFPLLSKFRYRWAWVSLTCPAYTFFSEIIPFIFVAVAFACFVFVFVGNAGFILFIEKIFKIFITKAIYMNECEFSISRILLYCMEAYKYCPVVKPDSRVSKPLAPGGVDQLAWVVHEWLILYVHGIQWHPRIPLLLSNYVFSWYFVHDRLSKNGGPSKNGITFDRNQTLDALNRETFNLALGSFVAFILLEMLFFACEELLAMKNSQSSILLGAKLASKSSSSAKNQKSNQKYQDGKSILIRILKRIIQSANRHYRGLIYSFLVQVFCAYRLYTGMSNKSVDGKINRLGWISRELLYCDLHFDDLNFGNKRLITSLLRNQHILWPNQYGHRYHFSKDKFFLTNF